MTRRSDRSNFGKTPDYLKEYVLATNESVPESESSSILSFHDILNSTIMPSDDENEDTSLKDVLRQLTEQMKSMQAEITKLKETSTTPKPQPQLTADPPLVEKSQATTHSSGSNQPVNPHEFGHSSGLNPNASTFDWLQPYRKPIVDLPTFDGTLKKWPKFYKTYLNTTTQYRYSDLDNLGRLDKALMGKAKLSVESMLIVPETVNAAIEQLKFLYGDEEKLVKNQIAELRSFPSIQDNKLQQLVDFSTEVRNLRAFIVGSECEKYLSNPLLLDELLKKLSITKQIEWMKYMDTLAVEATLTDFSDWISQAARYASKVSDAITPTPTQKVERKTVQKNHTFHANEKPTPVNPVARVPRAVICTFCKKNHKLTECDEYAKLAINEKWTIVKENNLCFACLRKGHPLRFCHSKKICPVDKCDMYHHILLHSYEEEQNSKETKEPCITNKATNRSQVLFKVLPITLHANNRSIDTFAFIDEGSSATLIDEELADQLDLQGSKDSLTLQWLNDQEITQESKRVMLEISERGSSKKLTLQNVQTVKGISLPMQSLDISKLNHKYQAIRSLPIQKYDHAVPKILIGLNNIHVTFHSQQRLCSNEGPIAVHTKLGWLVYGAIQDAGQSVVHNNVVRVLTVKEVDNWDYIHNQMKEYFSTEGFGCVPKRIVQSKHDERAEIILNATTKNTGNRYETGLLWRQDDFQLPDSKAAAAHRLELVERRMNKDEEYARLYKDNMNHFIEKGYAKKLSAVEANQTSPRTWYLPHFGVKNPAKPNKLRLVFDAASKVNNISLNDLLLTGPDLYENLLAILFRFRQGKFAVCADVREMFLQIRIIESDQDSQRFLWRNGNQSIEPEVYKMVSMIFGAKCSPASAQYVKNHHADKFSSDYPVAARSMKSSHYMDDYIQSFDSIQETIEVSQRVVEIHRTAGFELRNFISNSTQVANHFENTSSKDVKMPQPTEVCESLHKTDKILGMHWDSTADELLFELKFYKVDKRIIDGDRFPTKRELLSIAMSIYDPFGFLGNFTIYVKLLLQDMWRLSIDWDERIPPQFEEKWINWLQELHQVKHFRIPRCYCPSIPEADRIELHVLVDASERAFQQSPSFVLFTKTKSYQLVYRSCHRNPDVLL